MIRNRGFTLIELVIVAAILAIISLAVYSTFSSGIKIWQKINQNMPAEDVDIFFEKFTSDLRNSLKMADISFVGEEDKIEFATLVSSQRLQKTTVGKIRYRFDDGKDEIIRQKMDYSDIYNGEDGGEEALLKNIKYTKFQYYAYDTEKQRYLWQDEWIEEELPLAVRIEVELKNDEQTGKFIKTVSIPAS